MAYSQAWKEEPQASWQVEHQAWVELASQGLMALVAEKVAVQQRMG